MARGSVPARSALQSRRPTVPWLPVERLPGALLPAAPTASGQGTPCGPPVSTQSPRTRRLLDAVPMLAP